MPRVLPEQFFARPTLRVARRLLGKYLVRRVGKKQLVGKITEVEAYIGVDYAKHYAKYPWRFLLRVKE